VPLYLREAAAHVSVCWRLLRTPMSTGGTYMTLFLLNAVVHLSVYRRQLRVLCLLEAVSHPPFCRWLLHSSLSAGGCCTPLCLLLAASHPLFLLEADATPCVYQRLLHTSLYWRLLYILCLLEAHLSVHWILLHTSLSTGGCCTHLGLLEVVAVLSVYCRMLHISLSTGRCCALHCLLEAVAHLSAFWRLLHTSLSVGGCCIFGNKLRFTSR
jgi:hypothetical protein